MGEAFLLAVLDEYCGALQSLGSDLFGFLQNLGSVYQEMKTTGTKDQGTSTSSVIANRYDISFSCVPEQGRLTLHFRTAVAACGYLWAGILKVSHSFHHLAFNWIHGQSIRPRLMMFGLISGLCFITRPYLMTIIIINILMKRVSPLTCSAWA